MDHHSPSPSMFLGGGMTSSSGGGASSSMAGTSSSFMGMGVGQNQQMHSQQQQQHHSQHDEPELCLVCNDVATGYHYGTPSCNGCKTFFRRTVMKKQVFQCQYDGNCPVDKSVRCACRHCRFKKCLAVGMNKDAIQQNRDPIGYTKRTRRYPLVKHHHQVLLGAGSGGDFGTSEAGTSGHSSPFAAGASIASTPFPNAGPQSSFMHGVGPSSSSFASTSSSAGTSSFMNSLSGGTQQHFGRSGPTPSSSSSRASHSQQSQQLQQQQSPVTAEQIQEDMLLQRLIGVENVLVTIRNSKVNVQKSLNDLVMNRSIFEDPQMIKQMTMESFQMPNVLRRAEQEDYLYWHERDWYIMIEWAKMLPVYQQLSISDKLALLRHSAITYPSLIQCFYTPDVGPDTIVFPNGAFFDRTLDPNKPTGFQRKNFKMLDNLLNPIRKMQIDQNEFSGAKGIFFLNPGNFDDVGDSDADDLSPEAKSQIAVARSAITNALYRYMVQKRGTEDAADKFGKLLLLGTAIATMSCEMKEAVVVADFFDQIRFSGFARQLLLAKDEDDIGHQPMTQLPPQNQPMTQLPPQNQAMTQLPPQNQAQPPQNIQTTTVANMMPIQNGHIQNGQNGLIQNGGGHHHQPPQQFFNGNFPQISQQPMMAPMMNTLTSPAPTMMMNSMMNYSAGQFSNGIGQQMTMHHQHHQQQSMQHNPTTTAATMAMLSGLNAQMQQIQQQQHILMGQFGSGDGNGNNNNKMAINVGQFGEGQITQNQTTHQQQLQLEAAKTTPAAIEGPKDSTVEEQKDLNENNEMEEEEEDGQEQSQMQIQKLQQQLMEEKKQQHREMMGQTQLGPDSVHQTILPPQDQQPPFTPAMYNSEPQPPSAQSQQSFNNTSPPSLINLT